MNNDILTLNLRLLVEKKGIKSDDLVLSEDRLNKYEILEGNDSGITLRFNDSPNGLGLLLHSAYDIKAETDAYTNMYQFVEKPLLCIGFGLGHHLQGLLTQKKQMDILILNDEAFFIALHFDSTTPFLESENVRFVLTRDSAACNDLIKRAETEADKPHLILHSPSIHIREKVGDALAVRIANIRLYVRSYSLFLPSLMKNYAYNTTHYTQYFKDIQHAFTQKTVVITMSGPSLEADMKALKPYRDKYVLLAVTSALKPLEKLGIKPDFAIIQDTMDKNAIYIEDVETNYPLIAICTSSSELLKRWQGPIYLAFGRALAFDTFKIEPILPISGTVAFCAISSVLVSSPKAVVLTGLDLCFSQNKTHVTGAVLGTTVNPEDCRYFSEDYDGNQVPTDMLLTTYKMELEILFSSARAPIYNLTHFGARLAHTTRIRTSELDRLFRL